MKLFRSIMLLLVLASVSVAAQENKPITTRPNLAMVATVTTSARSGQPVSTLNDGAAPVVVNNTRPRTPPRNPRSNVWVQYEWPRAVSTKEVGVFFWDYNGNIRLPEGYRLQYWNGTSFVALPNTQGLAMVNNRLNSTSFDEIKTTRMRLELDSAEWGITSVLEWVVYKTDNSPNPPPLVNAGADRDVMIGGKTYLAAAVQSVGKLSKVEWKKISGPGTVAFTNPSELNGSATFSALGDYVLELKAAETENNASSGRIKVKVHQPPTGKRLDVVYTKRYSIDNKLWNDRAKAMIVNWIPYCIDQNERTDLTIGQGGIDNFIEAAKAIRGELHARHKGYVFSNAWVHQTVESICIALMVDPKGDKDMIAAQDKMRATLNRWIPIILAAQEPDGYLHTAFTLRDTARWKERWSPRNRGDHEGYVAGYFIESAINHYTLTEGKDRRLYDAAKKLADCWVRNIGPGKKEWYDGHQEMEQALVRFGRFVNDMEGNGKGDSYVKLAKFLLDSRKDGSEYDQSHVPVQQQYEAVGHAVRATYNYSAMADVAAETGDVDYQSAVMSLWNNLTNKKYYVTGGIGSGETSEGFGGNYSLRNNAYCESCSSAGLIFFQYKMNLAYHDAKYVDNYEETMYNALLGSLDLEGKNFYYTNPLSSSQPRDPWHVCPCCVGNIPRTLLMIPTWTYVTGDKALYVNLFIGSTINVERVAGTDVQMIQKTNYPWNGNVAITVNPKASKEFTLYVRVPNRTTSALYRPDKEVKGLKWIKVNGKTVTPTIDKGYAMIKRTWKAGDKVEFEMPMEVQKFTADERIEANKDRVALRYGPLVYNVEKADKQDIEKEIGKAPLTTEWKDDLLRGIMVIKGQWADGTPLVAIPNYARNNRIEQAPVTEPAKTTTPTQAAEPPQRITRTVSSVVWIKEGN
ncbi:glycoside hydrolase family 127 protein [Sediminibacterium roseum]|nr:beta-L-arabinofuranosidase domain-containing protein [Sediminibacterium roseum]